MPEIKRAEIEDSQRQIKIKHALSNSFSGVLFSFFFGQANAKHSSRQFKRRKNHEIKKNIKKMNEQETIRTRKIQLKINSSDHAFIQETYARLYRWQHICFRAANYIFTHHFIQRQLKDILYINDGIRVTLADMQKDTDGILTCSKMHTTYQVLAAHFKEAIPMHILSSLNHNLTAQFNCEKQSYADGERSLRNYKKTIPIPFRVEDIRQLCLLPGSNDYGFNFFKIPFRTYLGRDTGEKKTLLQQLAAQQIKLCSCSLQLNGGKIFLLAAFKINREAQVRDASVVAEVSLSIEYAITVSIGGHRYHIGNKEEFLYRRLAIQSARQRVMKAATYNRAVNGKQRQLKVLERFQQAEYNYVNHKLHVYSKRLVDICLEHNAGTLLLTEQQDKELMAKEDAFLLRNWSYYNLKEKILYKAKQAGIEVVEE